jgi:hypothetical protein
MRRLVVLTTALSLVACWPSAATAALPTIHNTLIVPGQSIGGIKVGASLQEVNAAWGSNCVSSVEPWGWRGRTISGVRPSSQSQCLYFACLAKGEDD